MIANEEGAMLGCQGEKDLSAGNRPDNYYSPAMAPMTMNGSLPEATASGSGASGGLWERSSSQAPEGQDKQRSAGLPQEKRGAGCCRGRLLSEEAPRSMG